MAQQRAGDGFHDAGADTRHATSSQIVEDETLVGNRLCELGRF